jgi:hypothetical protein
MEIKFGRDYDNTLAKYPSYTDKLIQFIELKKTNPIAKFGSKDSMFIGTGPLGKLKIKHAHISQNLSILYNIAGKPTVLYLYGIYSHKETGTSTTPNLNTQKQLAKQLKSDFPFLHEMYQQIAGPNQSDRL